MLQLSTPASARVKHSHRVHHPPQDLPQQQDAVQEALSLISRRASSPRVYLSCEMLGTEPVLRAVSRAFSSKIYLPPAITDACFQSSLLQQQRAQELLLLEPDVVTTTDASSRFWLWGGRLLAKTAAKHVHSGSAAAPLYLKPSTQKVLLAQDELAAGSGSGKAMARASAFEGGVHYVTYSVHSSRWEVLRAIEQLRPVAVLPSCGEIDLAGCSWLQPAAQVQQRMQRSMQEAAASAVLSPPVKQQAGGSAPAGLCGAKPQQQVGQQQAWQQPVHSKQQKQPEHKARDSAAGLAGSNHAVQQGQAVSSSKAKQQHSPTDLLPSKRQCTAVQQVTPAVRHVSAAPAGAYVPACRPPAAGPSLMDWLGGGSRQ